MHIKSTCLLLLLALCCCSGNAQQTKAGPRPWQFENITTVGLLQGDANAALQVLEVNGVQHKGWFAGIGIGLDYYRLRSIPVFIDVRKKLAANFFVYADAGANLYWRMDKDVKLFYINDAVKNGLYWEAGIGYKIKLHKQTALLFSGGYTYKKLTEQGLQYNYTYPEPTETVSRIDYNLNRVILKVGIAF